MRTDFDARRTGLGILREGASLLTHTVLFPFGYLPSRHEPRRARDLHTLVFVHGMAANRATFFPLQSYLWARGHRRQYAFNYTTTSGSIEAMAVDLDRRLRRDVRGGRIDLICHSLGGVVARTWLQLLGGDRRVDRLITLGSPHAGTHASIYVPTALVRQLTPGSPFLSHLDAQPPPRGVHVTSVAAGQDAIVIPHTSSLLPFGETHVLPDVGHTGLLLAPQVFGIVERAIGLRDVAAPPEVAARAAVAG